jgi:protein Mpv17
MLTQSVTTAVLFATGDTMAQQGVERRGFANQDLARTGRMAFYGGCIFGPAATTWFNFLQRKVVIPGRPNLEIVARVGLDQTVFASANLFVFLSTMAVLEGSDPKEKLKSTYTMALSKNWMVWPWVQLTNFKFTPLEHRVLVVNVVSLGEFISHIMPDQHDVQRTTVASIATNLGHKRSHLLTWVLGWNCYLSYLNSQGGAASVPNEKNPGFPPDA